MEFLPNLGSRESAYRLKRNMGWGAWPPRLGESGGSTQETEPRTPKSQVSQVALQTYLRKQHPLCCAVLHAQRSTLHANIIISHATTSWSHGPFRAYLAFAAFLNLGKVTWKERKNAGSCRNFTQSIHCLTPGHRQTRFQRPGTEYILQVYL